jgi:FkbM family methyltransferase
MARLLRARRTITNGNQYGRKLEIHLSSILNVVKNPGRWMEFGWRALFSVLGRRRIRHTVRCAYQDAHGAEAAFLRRSAAIAWGLSRGNVAQSRGYMHAVYRSQAALAAEAHMLETASIGFQDLRIHTRSTDANSSRDYLAGFDQSLTTFEVYRRLIAPGTAAVDVGANLGIHSLVLASCVGKQGRVYAYEPNSALRERFIENMTLNAVQNVVFRGSGAGSSDGTSRFSPPKNQFYIGLGKFDPCGSIETEMVTLDSDLRGAGPISLIKVDVEGMEMEVVRGARSLIADHRPALVLEYNPGCWTLKELRDEIAYPVKISRIPPTLLDDARPLDDGVRCPVTNILVVPDPGPGKPQSCPTSMPRN